MRRLLPPFLVALLLAALGLLAFVTADAPPIRVDRALPWDVPLPLGLAALLWARLHFRRKDAEIMTFDQPRALITDGPFRYSRNPMYLGFLLILVAAAMAVNTGAAFLAPFAFFVASALWYIPFEERMMRRTFGTEYDDYASRVRRWL